MRFESWVERASGAIYRKLREYRILAGCSRRAMAILNLALCKQESDTPTVSHPYRTAGTAAVRAMSVVLTPSFSGLCTCNRQGCRVFS